MITNNTTNIIEEELTNKDLEEKKKIQEIDEFKFGINIKEMLEKGLAIGHQASKLHPKMKEYIVGIKNTSHIINLEKTGKCLEKALEFIIELTKQNKILLIIGTKPPLRNLIEETAKELNISYITKRWLGGFFTNFEVFLKRIKSYKALEEEKFQTNFKGYTKKERLEKDKEIERLRRKFGGIKNLERLPDVIFICDIVKDKIALKEARFKKIPIIAIVDTNGNPVLVNYPIPANDGAIPAVKYILNKIKEVIIQAKSQKS